jgi:hypothetical protein
LGQPSILEMGQNELWPKPPSYECLPSISKPPQECLINTVCPLHLLAFSAKSNYKEGHN